MLAIAPLLLPVLAQAQAVYPATTPQAPLAVTEKAPTVPAYQAGVGFMWLPTAVVMSDASGERSAASASPAAFGVVPAIDRRISSRLTLGIAVPILFNLKAAAADGDGSSEVDALLRLTGWLPIASDLRLFGFAASGAYVILVPGSQKGSEGHDPVGVAAAFGGGAQWAPSSRWFVTGELGLHLGFKLGELDSGRAYPQATQYLQLGAGVGVPF